MSHSRAIGLLLSACCLGVSPTIGEPPPTAQERLVAAREIYLKQGPAAALPVYEEALEAFRRDGDRRGEAITIGLIGNCHKRFGDYERALELLGSALELKQTLGDRAEEAATLSHLGLVRWEMGDYDRAIARFEASAEIARAIGDDELRGINLNNLSLVYDELGDYGRSLAGYEEALAIYRKNGFARGESDTLGNIGGVELLVGRYRQAERHYQEALAISEREELTVAMSLDHGNLALAKLGLGETRAALEHFDRALELAAAAGAHQDEAYWLKGKGQALVTLGRVDEGLELFRRAVDLSEETGSTAEMIEALGELGELYALLGDSAMAERQFQRASEEARRIGLLRGVTSSLLALGDLEWRRGSYEKATALYRETLRRAEEAGEQSYIAEALLRLARVDRQRDLLVEADREAERALSIARHTSARLTEAEALHARAEVARLGGGLDGALALYGEAETVALTVGSPELVWQIEHGRGRTLEAAGRLGEAVAALEQAVAIIESVRERLRENRFRAGYLQDKYEVYVDLVRVLLALGETDKAFASAERLKARSYFELVHRSGPTGGTEEQRRRQTELRERVRQLERAIEQERDRQGTEYRQRAIDFFSEELALAEAEYQALLDDLGSSEGSTAGPLLPSTPTTARIRARLTAGTALVEYVVGQDELFVFLITPEGVHSRTIDESREALEARVELLRDLLLRASGDSWRRPSRVLARSLVQPLLEEGWLEGVEHLFVVPHGVLHYLPFACLVLEEVGRERLLVEAFDVSVLPSAATLSRSTGVAGSRGTVLALAPERAGLRFATDEVRRIGESFPSDSRVLVGEEARESAFKALAGEYRVLHLASHGYFNRLNPLLSGVELEASEDDDGYLEVHEILGLELDADLVTLSACDTALASGHFADVPSGEEFVGLTRAFLSAGSRQVLSTLWRVDDRSTVRMMERFYSHLGEGERPVDVAAALGDTQRAMLSEGPFSHPYYWAPFVVVGALGPSAGIAAEARSRRP